MSEATGVSERTAQARERFFNQGMEPDPWVAPHISRSWLRSRGAGVWGMEPAPMTGAQLRDRREASRLLLESAQPELDALAEHAIGHGCVVIVTDPSGLILDEIGSPDFLPKAQRVALLPGVEWSEQQCGTNAIGTVLVERQPLAVLGGEHFLAGNGALGCAASPIFDGRGAIAGVLDISGDAVRIDGHTLGMVRMASQQIEHRLLLAQARGDIVRFHAKAAVLGSWREALLAVVDGQVVAANRVALDLLGMHWKSVLDQPIDSLLGGGWRAAGGHAPGLRLPSGREVALSRERSAASGRRHAAVSAPQGNVPATGADDGTMGTALQAAVKVLDAGVPVLVTGETGVGKEVFARRLHAASQRGAGPLVTVNCAALPESLIEAELFGYQEGAFTGARRQGVAGRIREAHGGSLMLDEIGDMPLPLQTRLLRVLEDRLVSPLGGGPAVRVEFQLICATHRDLSAMAAAGAFRPDLLFRINGYEVHLPSLRERADKAELILRLFAELGGQSRRLRLEPDAVDALARRSWLGNIRELATVLRTLIALATPETAIGVDSLPPVPAGLAAAGGEAATSTAGVSQAPHLALLAQQAIERAVRDAGGNIPLAAQRLGVHRSTVYRHLKRHPL